MAGPPPSFPCICFLGDTSDGDTLLSPFGPPGRRTGGQRRGAFPSKEELRMGGEDWVIPNQAINDGEYDRHAGLV